MSETRIVVDPLTRIEGHMRMQAVLGADGKIADAWSTGTMWRGIEVILKGRDPATPGPSRNVSAASAPASTLWRLSALWKVLSASRSRPTPTSSVT